MPQPHRTQVLHALSGRVAGTDVPADQEDPLHDQLVPHIPPDFDGAPTHNAAQYYSAMCVPGLWNLERDTKGASCSLCPRLLRRE